MQAFSNMPGRLSALAPPQDSKSKTILDKPINKARTPEISVSAFAFLFSELVQYTQRNVHGIQDLEKRSVSLILLFAIPFRNLSMLEAVNVLVGCMKLNLLGYRVGQKLLELSFFREKGFKRETRLLPLLIFVNSHIWKLLFGKTADSLEKSSENSDEYMISDNDLLVNRFISVPKELSQLNAGAYVAGVLEAILDARVTAHTVPIEGFPFRTTILIKFDPKLIEREKALG